MDASTCLPRAGMEDKSAMFDYVRGYLMGYDPEKHSARRKEGQVRGQLDALRFLTRPRARKSAAAIDIAVERARDAAQALKDKS